MGPTDDGLRWTVPAIWRESVRTGQPESGGNVVLRFAAALLLSTVPVFAQQSGAPGDLPTGPPAAKSGAPVERQPLRGLHALEVEIEDVGSIAQQCNVSTADLEQAATKPLADASLRVENQRLTPYVYVNAHVVKVNAICVAAVSVSVRDPGLVLITYQQKDAGPEVANSAPEILLWEKESMLAGSADAFGTRVDDQVREFVSAFVGEVKQQNAPQ